MKEVTHRMRVDASVGHNLCPEAMKSLFRWLHQHWVVVAGEQSLAKDHATIMIVGHGTQAGWRRKQGGYETGRTGEESAG